eukprot:scaffold226480_cov15-Tisochrysis_lutea.AAC.1
MQGKCIRMSCSGSTGDMQESIFLQSLPSLQHVDPWNVQGGEDGRIDYNKLVEQVSSHLAHAQSASTVNACALLGGMRARGTRTQGFPGTDAHRSQTFRVQFGCSKLTEDLVA